MKLQTTHSINYNLVFRIVFISILVCVCFVASSFMVLESSEFFERFYTGNSKNFGFISAFLNEVFLVIMASVWVPAIQKGEKKKFHPANILIKGLVILLFFNTVGGASLNTVQKKLATIQEQKNRIEVLKILESQIGDQQENIDTFIGQEQRVNTVLATRKLNEIKEELKKLQTNQQSTFSLWVDILFISFVRFAIQLANVTSVWLASWLYRNPLGTPLLQLDKNSTLLQLSKQKTEAEIPTTPQEKIATTPQEKIATTPQEKIATTPQEKIATTPQEKKTILKQKDFSNSAQNKPPIESSPQQTFFKEAPKVENLDEVSESVINEISQKIGEVPNINLLNLANNLGITLAQLKKLHHKDSASFEEEELQKFLAKIIEMKDTER